MSALPKQVQDQINKANEILDIITKPVELNEDGTPKLDEHGQFIAIDEPAPVADELTIHPTPVAAEPAPVVEPAAEPTPVEDETMEHKYKVLQGKYNAEVPKLSKDLKESKDQLLEMRQRVNNTESILATMQATAAPAAPPAATIPPEPLVAEDEIERFGPDLIDLIGRVAKQEVLPELDRRIKPLDSRFDSIEENASNTLDAVARSERDKVLAALTLAVPKWETQNEDKAFLQWLNENDVYAGVARGALLTQAFRANDAGRVIAFFKGFQTENAVVTPESEVTPPLETPAVEPQQALEQLVAPGTPKTGTTGAPDESGKRIWTRADISAFYAQKNEYITRGVEVPEVYEKYEKDLFAAQNEGRVRP